MASKAASITAIVLCLNLVFFTLVSANSCAPTTPKTAPVKPKPKPSPAPVKPKPKPSPATPSPASKGSCPKDTLKLGLCGDLLNGVVHIIVGTPPVTPCCTLIKGLTDAEAALCLCTAIKANVLGINLNAQVSVSVLLNYCGKTAPTDFQCA